MRRSITAITVLALAATPAAALAESTPAADFDLALASAEPGTPTALRLHVVFKNPEEPGARPSPQRKVVIDLPDGSRIDGGAVAACHASDAELMARGSDACPAESRIGSGTLTLRTNGPPGTDPFVDDVVLFNGGDQLVELFTPQGSPANSAVGRRHIVGPSTLSEEAPPQPGGPPDGESAVSELDFRLDEARGMFTTPPACPADGQWRSRLTFDTADGHTYTVASTTPCRGAAVPAASGAPAGECRSRRVVALRVRRGARVRVSIAGERARRVANRRGVVRIDLRGRPRGRYRVTLAVGDGRATRRITRVFRTCAG
jgi:hypothetical protein